MKYVGTDREVCIGDPVLVEGGVTGIIVCDFERWLCLNGYESWLTKEKMVGGNYLSSGILVETVDIGMIHYAEPDETIIFNG
jgi:hypothetical protein